MMRQNSLLVQAASCLKISDDGHRRLRAARALHRPPQSRAWAQEFVLDAGYLSGWGLALSDMFYNFLGFGNGLSEHFDHAKVALAVRWVEPGMAPCAARACRIRNANRAIAPY